MHEHGEQGGQIPKKQERMGWIPWLKQIIQARYRLAVVKQRNENLDKSGQLSSNAIEMFRKNPQVLKAVEMTWELSRLQAELKNSPPSDRDNLKRTVQEFEDKLEKYMSSLSPAQRAAYQVVAYEDIIEALRNS